MTSQQLIVASSKRIADIPQIEFIGDAGSVGGFEAVREQWCRGAGRQAQPERQPERRTPTFQFSPIGFCRANVETYEIVFP